MSSFIVRRAQSVYKNDLPTAQQRERGPGLPPRKEQPSAVFLSSTAERLSLITRHAPWPSRPAGRRITHITDATQEVAQ